MKRLLVLLTLALALLVAGCGGNGGAGDKTTNSTLKVGATPVPHAEILKQVVPLLEKEGITLDIIEFTDYVTPNLSLDDGSIDANFFQHQPYLDDFNAKKGTKLNTIAKIHFEPMGLYSKKVDAVEGFKEGATIGIPGDATNGGRALVVLQEAGLIKLKDGVGIDATVRDIVEKKVEIMEMEAAQLPRSLDDLDGAVINGNYAAQANMTPADALVCEDANSEAADTYGNVLVVKEGNEEKAELKKLAELLQSDEIKQFIEENYKGAVIPVF